MIQRRLHGVREVLQRRFYPSRRFCILLLSLVVGMPALAAERIALVIGISEYTNTKDLPNPRNDARAPTQALSRIGFEVTLEEDLDRHAFEKALYEFGTKAETAELALVFYAGHGLQVDGKNYLMPKDAQLRHRRDLRYMIGLDDVISEAGLAKKLGIVILDACRNNPLAEIFQRELPATARNVSIGRGLGPVEATPSNTLIAFATSDNQTAEDGVGDHSPYTTALLQHLERPGLDIRLLFGSVRDTVVKLTKGQQRPYTYGSLGGERLFFSNVLPEEAKLALRACQFYVETDQLEQALDCYQRLKKRYPANNEIKTIWAKAITVYEHKVQQALERTRQALQTVKEAEAETRRYLTQLAQLDPDNIKLSALEQELSHVDVMVDNSHAGAVELQALSAQVEALSTQNRQLDEQLSVLRQSQGQGGNEIDALKQENQTLAKRSQALEAQKQSLQSQLDEFKQGSSRALTNSGELLRDSLRIGGEGPELVSVKGDCYPMGSPDKAPNKQEDERSHQVCVEDFYLGKYEVTVADFRRFVDATDYRSDAERGAGCLVLRSGRWQAVKEYNWKKPGYTQSDQHPAVCVSWRDAKTYLDWLSEQTRVHYRLPTEAEWEFAARAGSTHSRYWGDDIQQSCQYANVADQSGQQQYKNWKDTLNCRDGYAFAAPVGRFKVNAWDLHDMLGNVLEWTCSAYDKSYQGAEQRCAYGAEMRVMRGASWLDRAKALRAAFRNYDKPDSTYFISGFRVARPHPQEDH